MKGLLYIFLIVFLFSCKDEDKIAAESETKKVDDGFEMYEMSEMAALMEQMYVDNQRLKEKIIKGDTIGEFPQHFLKIHESVMTNKQVRDTFFKKQAKIFIDSQELIYKDPKNAKEHFNNGVDACIACHQQKCSGPIPRIKKLYIGEIPK
ncbi:hypothetical protein FLGE108171_11135 [Flavobacterium gelidilacus]|uniref:hypothetical protein n=1 Tax=Flavobacterium gelidilacus TaxID=206041 RepID=UPI0004199614|nr:hypothetical protein [Flavobacterium gelidilacus]